MLSGKREYGRREIESFVERANTAIDMAGKKVYWKESVAEFLGYPIECYCGVNADYDLFADE